ncbi:ESX secretion-associated protein EspG [Actinophytocola sp. NPDC049390]|uniref:ESX secretion-associated protein EspG n=1 Tax=Actinophytocola sp. NPDC049390 TaxID=3363894 RepID=UPI0037991D07
MTRFGLVELDLLATHAGATIPYPLRVPSFGRVPAERDELFAAAAEALQVRGLAGADGPAGLAADVVAALARRRGTVDLVVRGPGGERGAVAMVYGKHAVVCKQDFAGDRLVDVRRIPLSAVASALTALVPDLVPAPAMPVRLPAAAALVTAGHRHVVTEHGGNPDELDNLTELVSAVDGGGQLGATATTRDGGDVRDTRTVPELCWLDTPTGRVRVTTPAADEPDGWISVNPLSPSTLRSAAEDLVEALRR